LLIAWAAPIKPDPRNELENLLKSLRYVPTIGLALSYPVLLILSSILFFGRNFDGVKISAISNVLPDFYHHVSNFSISFILYSTVIYTGLIAGISSRLLIFFGIFLALINLVIELFISWLNTPDILDAVYGIAGVGFGLIFLFLSKRYGIRKNDLHCQNT
jgi:hypothetical protein